MDDLVKRLRQFRGKQWETTECYNGLRAEAANRIEALEAQVAARPVVPDWPASDSELAGRILSELGFSTDPSMEPGADRRRDKIAAMLAAAPTPPAVDAAEVVEVLESLRDALSSASNLILAKYGSTNPAREKSMKDATALLAKMRGTA